MKRLLEKFKKHLKDQQEECARFERQLLERNTELSNMRCKHEEELQRQCIVQDSQVDELLMQVLTSLRSSPTSRRSTTERQVKCKH